MKYLKSLIMIIFLFNVVFSQDVILEVDGSDLNYIAIEDIAGFQLSHDGCITNASGGDATANGFVISSSATTILAFSFTGAVIPAGEGVLLQLDGTPSQDCIFDLVFSSSGGTNLSVDWAEDEPPCDDNDDDGICDDDDDCVGEYDECGVCNGNGIGNNECDCDGNVEDCNEVCGGDAVVDECGICDGDGSECDDDPYYNVNLVETGNYQLVILQSSISSLDDGDEIGVFDANGIVESCDPASGCIDPIFGEVLVGSGIWTGSQLSISAIESTDLSDFGGPILNGAVDGNPLLLKVWKIQEQMEYEAIATWSAGGGDFGDLILAASELELSGGVILGCTDPEACNYNPDAEEDDGSCLEEDCSGECGGDAVIDECGICDGDGSSCEVYIETSVNTSVDETALEDLESFEENFEDLIESQLNLPEGTVEVVDIIILSRDDLNIIIEYTITLTDEDLAETNYDDLDDIEEILEVVEEEIESTDDLDFIYGCTDIESCNYDPEANIDDGSCLEEDCLGECGGDAIIDECGVCNGNNVDQDCSGECFGDAVEDCLGECGGDAVEDCLGECGGDAVEDCLGECNGDAIIDECGVCNGNNADQDCSGECFGDSEFDECGICDGDDSSCLDCCGIPNGDGTSCDGECGPCGEGFPNGACDCDGALPDDGYDCDGNCLNDEDGDLVCDEDDFQATVNGSGDWNYAQSIYQSFYLFNLDAFSINLNSLDPQDYIGVFNADVCVGWTKVENANEGVITIPIMGNTPDNQYPGFLFYGDVPEIVIFDNSENLEYCTEIYGPELPGFSNNEIFTLFETEVIGEEVSDGECTSAVDYEIPLQNGANLISFWALPEDVSVSNIMSSIGTSISGIIGQGQAASQIAPGTWVGSLSEITRTRGYWALMVNSDNLSILDATPTESSQVFDLNNGANLISFPYEGSSTITNALPDDAESAFNGIIGQGQAASQIAPGTWVGSLGSLQGTKGYWALLNTSASFSFIEPSGSMRSSESAYSTSYEFIQSMEQAFYFVEDIEGAEYGDWILAYHNDELVGSRQWNGSYTDIPAMGYDGSLETSGFCKTGDIPTFYLVKDYSGEHIELNGDISGWDSNGMYSIESLTQVVVPETVSLSTAYPNPFNPETTLDYNVMSSGMVELSIFDINGRLVSTLWSGDLLAGSYSANWDASNQPSGLYIAKLKSGNTIQTTKLVLLK